MFSAFFFYFFLGNPKGRVNWVKLELTLEQEPFFVFCGGRQPHGPEHACCCAMLLRVFMRWCGGINPSHSLSLWTVCRTEFGNSFTVKSSPCQHPPGNGRVSYTNAYRILIFPGCTYISFLYRRVDTLAFSGNKRYIRWGICQWTRGPGSLSACAISSVPLNG